MLRLITFTGKSMDYFFFWQHFFGKEKHQRLCAASAGGRRLGRRAVRSGRRGRTGRRRTGRRGSVARSGDLRLHRQRRLLRRLLPPVPRLLPLPARRHQVHVRRQRNHGNEIDADAALFLRNRHRYTCILQLQFNETVNYQTCMDPRFVTCPTPTTKLLLD